GPRPACNGPITWKGPELVREDIANLKAALAGLSPADVFAPVVSPGQIWHNFHNDYYPSHEAYVMALAEALRGEYKELVNAGFVIQLDDPGLALGWGRAEFGDKTLDEYRKTLAINVAAINHSLEG